MNLAEYNAVVNSTADEFQATQLDIGQLFQWQILKMNRMYSLPVNSVATLDDLGESPVARMQGFLKTLKKEMNEGLEILAVLCFREWMQRSVTVTPEALTGLVEKVGVDEERRANIITFMTAFVESGDLVELDRQALVMIADWLGDMTVYNRSEALKFGIPLESVLACIMGSNFTKLNPDGSVIKDENGKVQKGPNFLPPEAHIYATLFENDALFEEATARIEEMNRINSVSLPIILDPMAAVLGTENEEQEDPDYDDTDGEEDDSDSESEAVEADEEDDSDEAKATNEASNIFHE